MAIMYPNLKTIKLMKPKPTNGEFFLLQYLYEQLDDNYEIFFQSHINGFLPDIVILKKNYGLKLFFGINSCLNRKITFSFIHNVFLHLFKLKL